MMNINHIILTLIVFIPLAGALLLALLPDRGKTMQWAALAVTLLTFGLTLHLPFHYSYAGQPSALPVRAEHCRGSPRPPSTTTSASMASRCG